MWELDEDIMRQLRATFKIEAAEHIQAMNRVLLALEDNPDGDDRQPLLEEIFREAHSLKGSASYMGARRLVQACSRLEKEAQQGNLESAGQWLSGIEAEFAAAKTALELYVANKK